MRAVALNAVSSARCCCAVGDVTAGDVTVGAVVVSTTVFDVVCVC